MNVPLKKRHNYGKLNGSVSSSLNEPSAKRLLSSYTNYEDSEYDRQTSCSEECSNNGAATIANLSNGFKKRPHQYLDSGTKTMQLNKSREQLTTIISSSSVILCSSASNHNSSERRNDGLSSESASSGSSCSSTNTHIQSICDPFTEAALIQHNINYDPMNSKDRIQFWNISDEFSDIDDDFDDNTYFSKPIRSERLQKRMYKNAYPTNIQSPHKMKKDGRRKTESLTKKTPSLMKKVDKSSKIDIKEMMTTATNITESRQICTETINQTIVTNDIPSNIKLRFTYNKQINSHNVGQFKTPTAPNCNVICNHCSKNVTKSPIASNNNQAEFYKYLGIDTNPQTEKSFNSPDSNAAQLCQNRRSLRVFIQQIQNNSSKSNDLMNPIKNDMTEINATSNQTKSLNSIETNVNAIESISSTNIKQRRSYEPNESNNQSNVLNLCKNDTQIKQKKAQISKTNERNKVRLTRRKMLLPSPMLLGEMFKRYRQCFRQSLSFRSRQIIKRSIQAKKIVPNDAKSQFERTNACDELTNTFSPTSITHSNASSDSAIGLNSKKDYQPELMNAVKLNKMQSLQCQHDQFNENDRSRFRCPLDAKHGAVHTILTHSISPSSNDIIIVVQDKLISYWYSTSKVLCMFGASKSWLRIGEITRHTNDIEIETLHQYRLINTGESFPIYIEMMARESLPDEYRQCCLTFVYLNVYFVRNDDEQQCTLRRKAREITEMLI